MAITPAIKQELKRVVWDYRVNDKTLEEIFEGKISTFSLDHDKLCARLLLGTPWYRLLDCLGVAGLKEILTDRVIDLIRIKDVRDKFIYVKNALHGIA